MLTQPPTLKAGGTKKEENQRKELSIKGRLQGGDVKEIRIMSKRSTMKAVCRALRARRDKMEMSKVNHLGVMNSKHFFTY